MQAPSSGSLIELDLDGTWALDTFFKCAPSDSNLYPELRSCFHLVGRCLVQVEMILMVCFSLFKSIGQAR